MLKKEYNSYMRHYMARSRAERRTKLIKMLGGKCVRCFRTDGLQFDHLDPSSKSFTLSGNEHFSWDRIVEEASKCQLLCVDCHIKKTAEERGFELHAHGTPATYRHRKCRCVECKEAWSKCQKKYRDKKKLKGP